MEQVLKILKSMQEKMDTSQKEAEAMREDMKANQEKADANQAKVDANMKTMQEKTDDNQAKADADRKTYQNMLAKIEANGEAIQERMVAKMNTTLEEMNASQKEMLTKMERMTNVNQAKTDAKLKELTETIEKNQMELQTAEVSLDAETRKLQEDLTETFNKTCAAIEETKHELQARLGAVETRTERGNTPTASTSTAPPPAFNGNITWSVFRRRFEIVVEHNRWSDREKSTYIVTALKGRAADVLYGIPTSTPYEETLQALEDRFRDQHFSAAYHCRLTTRTQKAGESLQDFATATGCHWLTSQLSITTSDYHTLSHTHSLQFTLRADCDIFIKLSPRTDSAN
jgi:hypothetical protein